MLIPQFAMLRNKLEKSSIKKKIVCDTIFDSNWKRRVEHVGAKPTFDPEGIIIV